jgi:nucleoside-diphosphate-sugar epimerase
MRPLLLIGCGYTLRALALRIAGSRKVVGSTRNEGAAEALRARGVDVFADSIELARHAEGAEVVVSLPPDAGLDEPIAQTLARHRPARLVYLSSTGVYGAARGAVDEQTPVDEQRAASRLRSERHYLGIGAVVLRVAGIYGPGRGLHERLRQNAFSLPGDGSIRSSRVHVDDLCHAIEIALARAAPGEILNVSDDQPAPLKDVVAWLCARMGLPLPPSIPLEQAPETLRGDRAIVNVRLRKLGWTPQYPSYREGFARL